MLKSTASRLVLLGSPVAIESSGRRGKSNSLPISVTSFQLKSLCSQKQQNNLINFVNYYCTQINGQSKKNLLEEERLQNRNKEQQQWIVNVTKCGIAKEFQVF